MVEDRIMQKGWMLVKTLMVLVLAVSVPSYAAHGEKRAVKKAILMVAFGTSVPEAQKVFERIDAQAKESFPVWKSVGRTVQGLFERNWPKRANCWIPPKRPWPN